MGNDRLCPRWQVSKPEPKPEPVSRSHAWSQGGGGSILAHCSERALLIRQPCRAANPSSLPPAFTAVHWQHFEIY